MRAYEFSKKLLEERQGALVLDAILGPEYLIVPATRAHQRQKVDRFLIKRDAVLVHIADYKIDLAAGTTRKLALEHVSVERRGKMEAQGWLFTTPADWLVFYAPGLDAAYVLLTQRVRDSWGDILRAWPANATSTPPESGYVREKFLTRFIPVPIEWLRQHGLIHRQLLAVGAQLRLPLKRPPTNRSDA